MKQSKLILGLIFFTLMTFAYGIEVAPSSYIYRIDQGGMAQDVLLLNEKDKPERVKVSFKRYKDDSDEKSLEKWTTIYPKIVTIIPGGQKTVKFAIEPPEGLAKGEYRALIFFEELEQRALDFSGGKVIVSESVGTQLNFMISLGVVVYGYVGNPDDLIVNGEIKKMRLENGKKKGILRNTGEITRAYTIEITGRNAGGIEEIVKEKRSVVQGYSDELIIDLPVDFKPRKVELKGYNGSLLESLSI